jgi:adenine phosphoribosyltransferase
VRDLKALIRDIPDFPKKGIIFRDITPLLLDAAAFRDTVE